MGCLLGLGRGNGESPATVFQNPPRTVVGRTETWMDAEVWVSRVTVRSKAERRSALV